MDGFSLHQLDSSKKVKSFGTGMPKKIVAKQVAFGEDYEVVVGSSNHRSVYVLDTQTGTTLNILCHAKTGLVQTITV